MFFIERPELSESVYCIVSLLLFKDIADWDLLEEPQINKKKKKIGRVNFIKKGAFEKDPQTFTLSERGKVVDQLVGEGGGCLNVARSVQGGADACTDGLNTCNSCKANSRQTAGVQDCNC